MRLALACVPHEGFHCEGEGIIAGVPVPLLVPSDEVVSWVEVELEDMPHFVNVGELLYCCLLIKMSTQPIYSILIPAFMEPLLQINAWSLANPQVLPVA